MIKTYENGDIGSKFIVSTEFSPQLMNDGKTLMFVWNDGRAAVDILVDDQERTIEPNQILCTTYLHHLQFDNTANGLKVLIFNREFYCIHTNDSEVSCNGLLFFGSNFSPILTLDNDESDRLNTLFAVLNEEFDMKETGQEEMLRILLKRFIIRCTRLANKQLVKNGDNQSEIDLIRHFNVLVEEHFKTKKSVSEYAELMYKSPKTIANVFSKNSDRTPLEVIHERVIIESKRMILYTDKTVKEIGMDLGYDDPAQFSKLFKKHVGLTAGKFRNKYENQSFGKN
ncbi:MAG: AraC family transcriptional regulator [Balneolaceae bacterium]